MKFPKKVITLTDLWVFSSEKSSDFYLSSWQKGESPVPMLIVRLVLAGISSGIFAWSLYSGASWYWLVFLTNWGILFVFLMTISGLSVSIMSARKKLSDASSGDLPWYVSSYWLIYNVITTVAIMITGLYWILLYNPDASEEDVNFWLDLSTHGFNSCIVFIELMVSRTPLRFVHIYQPLTVGLWYLVFSVIYYFAGGTDEIGNPYIYSVLNWQEPDQCMTLAAVSLGGVFAVFTSLWLLTIFRDKVSVALIRTTSLDLPFTPPDRLSDVV
ncbi:protein rolling stone-like [Leptidea sinapis]|uniref:protein rolling stone-like n=1 Tax=Leptidea sinapis TaxID=189913 RepID=UPI0021C48CB0|nr:protein rolling stone-like [Leptidea sinapis]